MLCLFLYRVLQTLDSHKKKGYAELVVKALSKKLAEDHDIEPLAFIVKNNFASEKLFSKIGFKYYQDVSWIKLKLKQKNWFANVKLWII